MAERLLLLQVRAFLGANALGFCMLERFLDPGRGWSLVATADGFGVEVDCGALGRWTVVLESSGCCLVSCELCRAFGALVRGREDAVWVSCGIGC